MEIHKVILSKKMLAEMPEAERTLLLLLAHANNEINVLSKLILMMRKDPAPSLIVDHVEAGQTFIIHALADWQAARGLGAFQNSILE
jgi:hypothetical protein